ncbi:MAG: hypothetical protein ACRC3B_15590 [Bacteroidia bacterium]
MKIFYLSFAFIALSSFLVAQTTYKTYKFSGDIEAELERDTMPWKNQSGAVNYSFIGNYINSLAVWDLAVSSRTYIPTKADSAILNNYTPQSAKDYLINRSKNEQIIIINEAHHNPKHRTFTRSLLNELYKNGYRYLGLEAIADSAINTRNYAIQESGYYTVEPEFGNLIYEARKLGFVIFGYEASEGKNGKEREIEQAQNIQKFMQSNKNGKYLIHCGFDHVYENEVQNWEKAMAGRLKEYTGIDPFTIDQVKFTERSKPEFSHWFSYATKAQNPFVFVNQNNEVFNGLRDPKQTDIVVIHPITRYVNERPNWLAADRSVYRLPAKKRKKHNYPIQVLAFRVNEFENNGVPADIIELKAEHTNKPLYLQEGSYKIVIRNCSYEVVETFDVAVKK